MPLHLRRTIFLLLALAGLDPTHADVVQVGVAANFSAPMKQLATDFAAATGHQAVLSFSATGALYGQIKNGAPFEVLLSADVQRPARLEQEGYAVPGTRFTYARGRLALWSARADGVDAQGEVLRQAQFKSLAIASPKLAPYGAAAVEVMAKLGLSERLRPKLVTGQSIGQTYAFVATGNAQLGFVALSQVFENGKLKSGSAWVVPAAMHHPIQQDAVLLMRGKNNPAATALMQFLTTPQAKILIRSYGYDV